MKRSVGNLVLIVAVPLALLAGSATTGFADDGDPAVEHMLRHDALAVSSPLMTRIAVLSPGRYTAGVLSIFKLRIDRFLPTFFGLDREKLRPYLLGGRTVLRLPWGQTVGEDIPDGRNAVALHVGGGAEFRLRDRLFLSMDYGRILQSGMLSDRSYSSYKLGLLYDF